MNSPVPNTAPIAPKFSSHTLAITPAWLALWAAALTFVFLLLPPAFGGWDAELYAFCNTGLVISMVMVMICLGCSVILDSWAHERDGELSDAYCSAVRVWEAEQADLKAQASAAVSALADFADVCVPLKPAGSPRVSEWKLTKDGTRRYRRVATQVMVTRWTTKSEPIEFPHPSADVVSTPSGYLTHDEETLEHVESMTPEEADAFYGRFDDCDDVDKASYDEIPF